MSAAIDGDFEYSVAEGHATITGYLGAGGDVTIPPTLGGCPVIAIHDHAFANNDNITSLIIPEGVTTIGYAAFSECSALTSVTIPNTVTSLGESAFYKCSALTSVTIGNGVTSIGLQTFYSCPALSSVNIPDSVTSIGVSAFLDCTSLSSITIPDSVTSIANKAFWGCSNMVSFTMGNGVITIGDSAFRDCDSLTSITIGDGVTTIGNYAFFHCSSLASIILGKALTTIGDSTFYGCSSLTSISFHGLTAPSSVGSDWVIMTNASIQGHALRGSNFPAPGGNVSGLLMGSYIASDYLYLVGSGQVTITGYVGAGGDITIPSTIGGRPVTVINNEAFRDKNTITSVVIPDSVITIGDKAFYQSTSLTSVTIPGSVTLMGTYVFYFCTSLTSVTIENGVTTINDRDFAYCTSLTSITLPDSVTTIGIAVFYHCSALSSINIPDNVTVIGGGAFSYTALSSIFIPDSVISIGDRVFERASSLTAINVDLDNPAFTSNKGVLYNKTSTTLICCPEGISGPFTIPDTVTAIGDYAFQHCSALTSVTIPDSVTSIGQSAFQYCSFLESVTIPDSVTYMGAETFRGCTNLASVIISNNVTTIGFNAFEQCTSLASVTLGSKLTIIDYSAFRYCTSLTSVDIPVGVTMINSYAFANCNNLTTVTIPQGVTHISSYAFTSCSALKSISIPDSVDTMGNYVFDECTSLVSIVIPNKVTSLGIFTFQYCSALTSVTIGSGVTTIGYGLFFYCTSLTSITFKGLTMPTSVGSNWIAHAPHAIGHAYYSSNFPAINKSFYGLIMGEYIPEFTYTVTDGNATITGYIGPGGAAKIPDTLGGCPVVAIGASSFRYNANITSLLIPDNVTSIGNFAFADCSALTSITIGNAVTSIGTEAFRYCTGLTSVTIPDNVTTIGFAAFFGCSALTFANIGSGVTSIDVGVFYGCSALTAINVDPDNLNYASVDGVLYSEDLTVLIQYPLGLTGPFVIPDGVITIGNDAFRDCSGLTSITIPNSVTSIGVSAFSECTSLSSINMGSGVTTIYSSAFAACSTLTSITIPNSVSYIDCDVFAYCYGLTSITFGSGLINIGGEVFYECSSLSSLNFRGLTMPTSVSEYWLWHAPSTVRGHAYPSSNFPAPWSSFNGLIMGDHLPEYTYTVSDGNATITGYTGPGGDVTIPSTLGGCPVIAIGDYSFTFNENITSLTIPNSVQTIGHHAFFQCSVLTYVTIPDSITSIGNSAFCRSALTSITIPNNVTFLGSSAFKDCKDLNSVIIGSGVTHIGWYTFSVCSSLSSVSIGSGVTSIGYRAFEFCKKLFSINFPNGLESIDTAAFASSGLISVTFPKSVTSIGAYAFESCTSLESVVIPDNVTTIDSHTFIHCHSLNSVSIGSGVTSIGNLAFFYCQSLTSITIPDNVLTIGDSAFDLCLNLTSVTIPDGVTSIGNKAFYSCISLTSVTIGNRVTSIGANAFNICTNLTSITFHGLIAPTTVGDNWVTETNASIRGHAYYASNFPAPGGNFYGLIMGAYIWEGYTYTVTDGNATITGYLEAGGVVTTPSILGGCPVIAIGDNAFRNNENITRLTVSSTVQTIGAGAFSNCVNMTSITIGAGVMSIGDHAFDGCLVLLSIKVDPDNPAYSSKGYVYINNMLLNLELNCLYDRSLSTLIRCPEGRMNILFPTQEAEITAIHDGAFLGCKHLLAVYLPDSVTIIGDRAFQGCEGLTSFTVPDNVAIIGGWAFAGCSNLTSISIGAAVTSMCEGAFMDCQSLPSIDIPGAITSLQADLFHGCSSLTSITVPSGVTSIGSSAFSNCTSLISITFLGLGAPTTGTDWIENTNLGLLGHAYELSEFPSMGSSFNGLTMGSYLPCEYTYTFELGQVTITGYLGSDSEVEVPSTIGGCPVIGLHHAFEGRTTITSVVIPYGVVNIGESAFNGCINLLQVTIPDTVVTIGASAFSGCVGLTSVTIPDSVINIGDYAFYHCQWLTWASIGTGLESIGDSAFAHCYCLASILFQGMTAPTIVGTDWIYLSGIAAPFDLRGYAYYGSDFSGHGDLWNGLMMGPYLTVDYTYIISSDFGVNQVTITGYIGSDTVITIPSEIAGFPVTILHSLGESDDITSVTIPDSVTTFDSYAMYHNTALTTVNIGCGFISLGSGSFSMCPALTAVNISPANPNFASLDGVMYSKDMSELIYYPYGKSGGFVIPNGVQIIRDRAFYTCPITSIYIPDTVTFIGNSSFEACRWLTSVTIPDSVTYLGNTAFSYCISLTSLVIGDHVQAILPRTFWYCSSLSSLTIGDNVTYIGDFAFQDNFNLTSLNIPDSVTEIDDYAFYWCYRLYDVTIGSGITRIGNCAFLDCWDLYSITFLGLNQPSVGAGWAEDAGKNYGWGNYARGHAYQGSNFPAPGGSLGGLIMGSYIPFDYTFIFAYGQVGITGYTGSGGAISIPDEIGGYPVTAIGNSVFYGCSTLTSVIIPDSVTSIGDQAFGYCQSLTHVTIGSGVTTFGTNVFAFCSALSSVDIRDGVTTIGNSAFYGCSALTSVGIPNSVMTIEGQAFGECSALSSLVIGNGVTFIGMSAFAECTSLTSVTIPSSVTLIGTFVFGGCSALTAIDVDPDNTKYASVDGVLYNKDLTILIQYPLGSTGPFVIPDGVVRIGDYGFYECSGLTSIAIPDSVTTIGAHAFRDCGSITSVTIPYSVTTIGTWGFGGCVNLASIIFQGFIKPTTVGSYWISGSDPSILGHAYPESNFPAPGEPFHELTMGSYLLSDYSYTIDGSQVTITGYIGSGGAISIPDEIGGYPVLKIGDDSFQYNNNITSLTIPSSVDVIGEYAFDHCSALESLIIIGSGSTIIEDCSFQGSGVKTVVIGGGVRSIGEHAFGNCHMTSFTVEEGLETICLQAFDYSSISEGLFLPITVTSISSMENDFRTMGAFFYCELPSIGVDEDNPVYASLDGVLYDKALGKLLVYPSGRPGTSFTVPTSVTLIDNYSFFDCKYLVSLTVPGSVNAINMGAFSESDTLSSVIIENGLTVIGLKAFFSCYALSSVTFPESLTHIGDSAFWDCRSLSSIELREGLLVIGPSAFYHCSMTTLDIPDSVTTIGGGAFSACKNLITVNVGSGVESMAGAFYGCSALTAINVDAANSYYASIEGALYNKTITALVKYPAAKPGASYAMPNTVSLIVTDALIGCSNLLSLTLSDALESIEGKSIGCSHITYLAIPSSVTHIGRFAFSDSTSLLHVDFLGMTPPVGDPIDGVYYLLLGTPSGALGHAYCVSSFPAPGERFGGLLMGPYLADVTFSQTGVDTSNTGIVLTVDGTGYQASQLPITFMWYGGSIHSFEWSETVSIDFGTRYGWQSASGLSAYASGTVTVPDIGGTISAVYATQHKVSFVATGLDSDAGANTVLTVGTMTYGWNDLPTDIWVNEGTTFSWSSPVPTAGERVFTLVQHSGLASPIVTYGTETAEYFKSMTISGHVYITGTTTGAADWHMQLWKGGSQVGTDFVTDATGAYSFTVTLPGTYQVMEVLKDCWTETAPILSCSMGEGSTPSVLGYDGITVTSGIDVDGLDLENFEWFAVTGVKFFDANGNGLRESDEPRLQNWAISIERDGVPYLGPILTDADGRYEFIVKDPGSYVVTEQEKYQWVQTCPLDGKHLFDAQSGHDEIGLDFGNWLGGQAVVTTSDLSMFDTDGNTTNGRQFKLLFTPDVPDFPNLFTLTASNPGQFYFNAFFLGSVSEGDTFVLNVPFPFVTQGDEPIHVYSGLNTNQLGWLVPGTDISSLFGFSATAISWTYDGQSGFSDRAVITLTALDDYAGFLYINVHLDYGLKKNIGELSPGGNNDAVGTTLTIEEGWQYEFSVTGPESLSAEDEVMNVNSFKRSPGFGGLVLDAEGDPVVGATIEIWLKNTLIGTVVTDEDGWYMLDYKHLGKPTTFTLKLYIDDELIMEITVTVKPASFSMVIFDLGTPSEPPPPPPEEPPEEPPVKPPKPPKVK